MAQCQGKCWDKATKEWRQCQKTATVHVGDECFCKVHDPFVVLEKRKANVRKFAVDEAVKAGAAECAFNARMKKHPVFIDLVNALEASLEWIDAVPADMPLPTMPGFDRDHVNDVLAVAKSADR
jgi:hypothetical protein